MEGRVLGAKGPLYGRRTAQIKLLPFDYLDAARFLPESEPEELVNHYATFGGTPYYLAQLDASAGSYERNVLDLCFDAYGPLREEPMMLLREELREPSVYYSVLQSMAGGHSSPKDIAEHAGVSVDGISAYLRTLEDSGLAVRKVPFGDDSAKSRKGMWVVGDPFLHIGSDSWGRTRDLSNQAVEAKPRVDWHSALLTPRMWAGGLKMCACSGYYASTGRIGCLCWLLVSGSGGAMTPPANANKPILTWSPAILRVALCCWVNANGATALTKPPLLRPSLPVKDSSKAIELPYSCSLASGRCLMRLGTNIAVRSHS